MDANTTAFLNTIGITEGADYNTLVGGGTFSDYSQFPQWAGITVGGQLTHAAGKYQFEPATWAGVAAQLGLTDFTPASQDAGAAQLIANKNAANAVSIGDTVTATKLLNTTWASFPGSPYGQPVVTQDQFNTYFTQQGGTLDTDAIAANSAANAAAVSNPATTDAGTLSLLQRVQSVAQSVATAASDNVVIFSISSAVVLVAVLLIIFLSKKKKNAGQI